jgi:hypothetical protein
MKTIRVQTTARRALIGLGLLALATATVPAGAGDWPPPEVRRPGPVPYPIISPAHLRVYQPAPVSPHTLEKGSHRLRLDLSESNVLHPADDPPGVFQTVADLEISRVLVDYEAGVSDHWDLGVEVPVYYFHAGFLDGIVEDVELAVGKLKPRRRDERAEQFAYRFGRDGGRSLRADNYTLWLGDVAVTARRRLGPDTALILGLQIPTGDADKGAGSGGFDLAFGVASEWRPGRFTVHGGLSGTLRLGQPDVLGGLTAMPTASGWLGAAYPVGWLGPRWNLHAQLAASTQAYRADESIVRGRPEGENRTFTGHVIEITPAISYTFDSGAALWLGITEDFLKTENTASDVTVFASLQLAPRRR